MASTLGGVIGSLRAVLSADSAQFSKGLGKARKDFQKFGVSIKGDMLKLGSMLKNGFVKIVQAATVAFGAIGAGAVLAANDAKEIVQKSSQFGMDTDSYQGFVQGAKEYGLEQDKVNDIIKDANEKLGEYLAVGSGGYKDFMDQIAKPLGVSGEDLIKLPPQERFIKMQSMMEEMGANAGQQSFYWESIASDATYMIPLLANNGEKLKEMTAEFQKMGLILSGETLTSLTTFKTSLTTIGQTMKGWGNLLISGFAPQLAEASARLSNFLKENQAIRDFFYSMGVAIGSIITAAMNLAPVFSAIGSTIMSVLQPVFENFDRLIVYAGTAAAVWGVGYVAAMVASIASTLTLSGAMGVLRTAIAGTGLGLLVILVGEVMFRFVEFTQSIGGVKNAFELLKIIGNGVLEQLMNGAKAAGTIYVGWGKIIMGALISAFSAVNVAFLGMIKIMENGLNWLIDAANELGAGINTVTFASDALGLAQKNLKYGTGMAKNGWSDMKKGASDFANIDLGKPFKDAAEKAAQMKKATEEALKNGKPTKPNLTNITDNTSNPPMPTAPSGGGGGGQSKEAQEIEKQKQAYEDLKKRVADLGNTYLMTAEQKKVYDEQAKIGSQATKQEIEGLVAQESKLESLKEAMTSVGDSFKSNFKSMIDGTKSFKESLGSFLADIASMLANSAMNQLWGSIGGGLGGILAGALGGPTLPAHALGTNGSAAGFALVGERGPELMNLRAGTKIIPNHKTNRILENGMGSGGNSRMEVSLSPDLEVRILDQAKQNSISVSKQTVNQFDKSVLNGRIDQYSKDTRRRN